MSKVISILFNDCSEASQLLQELSPNIKNLEFQDKGNILREIESLKPDLIIFNAKNKSYLETVKSLIKSIRNNIKLRRTSISVLTQENINPSEEEILIDTGANIIIPTPSEPKLWKFKLEKLINIPERYKIRAPVQIITWAKIKGIGDFVQGMALNINLGGMLLELPLKLAPDTKIDIFFSLPGDTKPLSCVGRIVWQDKNSNRCGVEFLAQRGNSHERLSQFLDEVFSKSENSSKESDFYNNKATDEIRWETLLRANDARKDAILNAAFDCIVAVDQEDKILEFNEIAEKTFGYPKTEMLLKRRLDKLLPGKICLELRKFLFNFVEDKDMQKNELWETQARRSDGSTFPVEIRTKAIYAEREALLIINIKDVTYRKKMMVEYRRAAQLAALGTVAAGVAHEINNPLQGILNYATLLHRNKSGVYQTEDIIQRIIKEVHRIEHISKNLLYYSKENSVEMIYCNIQTQIENALNLMDTKILKKGQSIKRVFAPELPEIKINPQSIQQVIMNLVDNASDAIALQQAEGRSKDIHINVVTQDGNSQSALNIEVYDEGIGMSREVIEHATEAFFSTKHSSQGTGLGLSIVNDIICDHGGTLTIESEENQFTKISVMLPL